MLPADADADYPASEITIDARDTGDHYFAVLRNVSGVAQFVAQKRRAMGLRMALGAQPMQILTEVFRYSVSTTGIGPALVPDSRA